VENFSIAIAPSVSDNAGSLKRSDMSQHKIQNGFSAILILIVVVLVASLIGYLAWAAQQKPQQPQQSNADQQRSSSSVSSKPVQSDLFKIQELNVGFRQGTVSPVYATIDSSYNGTSYKILEFTTKELINKGAQQGTNACNFIANGNNSSGHFIIAVRVYKSQSDLLAVEGAHNSHLTASSIVPANGYVAVGDIIFYVPQDVEAGQGVCLGNNAAFENQQRDALRSELMTLQPVN